MTSTAHSLEEQFWRGLGAGLQRAVNPLDVRSESWERTPFRDFITESWHIVEPANTFQPNWHIDALVLHLEALADGQIRNLLITMPPRMLKSLVGRVFFSSWLWTFRPWTRFLWSSYASALSIRDNVKCRRIIQSQWFQARWGHVFRMTSDQNVKQRFENDKTGYLIATSVGGVGTGEGGDIVGVDDPHKVDEVESDVERAGVLEWWDKEMSTRLNDPKTGARIIIQQRVHQHDLAGHVLEQGGYEHLNLPMEYDPKTSRVTCLKWKDPRRTDGELLAPARFDAAAVQELKVRLGAAAASAQLNQRPSPREGNIFKRAWWRFYVPPDYLSRLSTERGNELAAMIRARMLWVLPEKLEEQMQSWDLTFKDTAGTDMVVGQVWGRKDADKYLLDEDRGQRDFPASLKAVLALSGKWPLARRKLVEDKANGPAVISQLRSHLDGLVPWQNQGGVLAQANACTPMVESGNVYLPHPLFAPWVQDFIEEHAAYPNGQYDDRVAASTQALLRFAGKYRVPKMDRPVHWG